MVNVSRRLVRIPRVANRTVRRVFLILLVGVLGVGIGALWFALELKQLAFDAATLPPPDTEERTLPPFPVGVDASAELITEQTAVERYLRSNLAAAQQQRLADAGWWPRVIREVSRSTLWQSLASPHTRILVIWPGERKEQVVTNFGDILNWDRTERDTFHAAVTSSTAPLPDGVFYPGTYVVARDASPEEVATKVADRFTTEVLRRYPTAVSDKVPLRSALTIASLLERESYEFDEMRTIAGVIWHRLFIDMPLQLDASLQYVKGSRPTGPWWPAVHPADKFVSSPYNTYEHTGLPPAPIANPSAAAILAALNPRDTNCRFYFHTNDGTFHCSSTYEEHVERLQAIYGRGR